MGIKPQRTNTNRCHAHPHFLQHVPCVCIHSRRSSKFFFFYKSLTVISVSPFSDFSLTVKLSVALKKSQFRRNGKAMNAIATNLNVTRRTESSSKLPARRSSPKDARKERTQDERELMRHSSTLEAHCSNIKQDARNERTGTHKTSAN